MPTAAAAGSTRAIARLACKVGENVPEVTSPTCCVARKDDRPLPGDPPGCQFQADASQAGCGLESRQGGLAGEFSLVELDGPAYAGRVRVDRLRKLVTVKRHRGLEPKGVAGTQAARLDTMGLSRFPQCVPQVERSPGRHDHLESILPGITGPANHRVQATLEPAHG